MEKKNFNDLNISEELKKAIYDASYTEMTPVQELVIPNALTGMDLIAQAPTGTGKTCAFAIPAIESLESENHNIQALILCPTRELAVQVSSEIKKLSKTQKWIKISCVYGGQSYDIQLKSLSQHPQIVVGTPGRVIDLQNKGYLHLDHIHLLILDEADEMLDMGFKEDLDTILKNAVNKRQTMLFSATMPQEIVRISKNYQNNAQIFTTGNIKDELPKIDQYYVELKEENKLECLARMIDSYDFRQALVFCRTKKKVVEVTTGLTEKGYFVESLHGDMAQFARDQVMSKFKRGICRVLIATDVAARGIDVNGIDAVFNYDLAEDVEYHVHRVGRTARAGRSGYAYTFVTRREYRKLMDYAHILKIDIKRELPPTYEMAFSNKMNHYLNHCLEHSSSTDLSKFKEVLQNKLYEENGNLDVMDLCSILLREAVGKTQGSINETDISEDFSRKTVKKNNSKDSSNGSKKEFNSKKDSNSSKKGNKKEENGITKLFINLGDKDGLSKKELYRFLTTDLKLKSSDITDIAVLTNFSFLRVKSAKANDVIRSFKKLTFKGKHIYAEIAKK